MPGYDITQCLEGDHIVATPTLVKILPEPLRRIIGDLSDTERVFAGLDLMPLEHRQ
jgi:circadian clock protein KaiB